MVYDAMQYTYTKQRPQYRYVENYFYNNIKHFQ